MSFLLSTKGKGNFPCKCGKSYSYYSSLSKHIKIKHNGDLNGTFKVKSRGN